MEWALSEEDQTAEMREAFVKVGRQFKVFYEAMREAGLSKKMAKRLTASYGRVVCDLLYMDGSGACDDGG